MPDPEITLERLLTRDAQLSLRDALRHSGLDEDFARRDYAALGLLLPDLDAVTLTAEDLDSLKMLRLMLDTGVPEATILELARIAGRGAAQTAEAAVDLIIRTLPPDADDAQAALVAAAARLLPALTPLAASPVRLHLREALRRELQYGDAHEHDVAVAFADLVGFTELADRAAARELADVIDRLGVLAAEAAEPPVRVVKLLGDAAMFVGGDCEGVLRAACRVVQSAADVEGMPPLAAGVTFGPALHRAGDWYGRTVNTAHRLSGVAKAGEVVATPAVAERAPGSWDDLGPHELKGLRDPVTVLRWQPEGELALDARAGDAS